MLDIPSSFESVFDAALRTGFCLFSLRLMRSSVVVPSSADFQLASTGDQAGGQF